MKKRCSIHFMSLLLALIGIGDSVLAQGASVKTSVPGNTVVQDLAVDSILVNCDVSYPNRICSLPPNAPQNLPAWLDIKSARITETRRDKVNLFISLYEPVPPSPNVPFVSYFWQFQDGCIDSSPTDKTAIFVKWDGNTNTWSGHWNVLTNCNPRGTTLGDPVQFKFTKDGIKVRVPLDELITFGGQSLKWFAGVRRLPFEHGYFSRTLPVDVAPDVIEIDFTPPPPSVIHPEDSAIWDQR